MWPNTNTAQNLNMHKQNRNIARKIVDARTSKTAHTFSLSNNQVRVNKFTETAQILQ